MVPGLPPMPRVCSVTRFQCKCSTAHVFISSDGTQVQSNGSHQTSLVRCNQAQPAGKGLLYEPKLYRSTLYRQTAPEPESLLAYSWHYAHKTMYHSSVAVQLSCQLLSTCISTLASRDCTPWSSVQSRMYQPILACRLAVDTPLHTAR